MKDFAYFIDRFNQNYSICAYAIFLLKKHVIYAIYDKNKGHIIQPVAFAVRKMWHKSSIYTDIALRPR